VQAQGRRAYKVELRETYLARRILRRHVSLFASIDESMRAHAEFYAAMNDSILKELALLNSKTDLSLSEVYKWGRLDRLNELIIEEGKALGTQSVSLARSDLRAVYTASGQQLADSLTLEWVRLPSEKVTALLSYPWSGDNFSSRIWDNTEKLITTVRQTLTRGFVTGDSFHVMASDLDNVMGRGLANADRLIRTEGMFFINQSQLDQYREWGFERVRYLAIDDNRTCDDCAVFDRQVFEVGSEEPLPLHPNCRCTYIPVVEDLRAKLREEGRSGKDIAYFVREDE